MVQATQHRQPSSSLMDPHPQKQKCSTTPQASLAGSAGGARTIHENQLRGRTLQPSKRVAVAIRWVGESRCHFGGQRICAHLRRGDVLTRLSRHKCSGWPPRPVVLIGAVRGGGRLGLCGIGDRVRLRHCDHAPPAAAASLRARRVLGWPLCAVILAPAAARPFASRKHGSAQTTAFAQRGAGATIFRK